MGRVCCIRKTLPVLSGVDRSIAMLLMPLALPREIFWISRCLEIQANNLLGWVMLDVTAQSITLGSASRISSSSTTEWFVPLTMGKAFLPHTQRFTASSSLVYMNTYFKYFFILMQTKRATNYLHTLHSVGLSVTWSLLDCIWILLNIPWSQDVELAWGIGQFSKTTLKTQIFFQ